MQVQEHITSEERYCFYIEWLRVHGYGALASAMVTQRVKL